MMLHEQPGEKIKSRDLQRVIAARRALREYAPYEPPHASKRTYATAMPTAHDRLASAAPMTDAPS